MANNNTTDLYLRPLPFLDEKWLRADLINSLRSIEDAAILWNNLIQDCELVSSPASPVLNSAGQWAYLGDDGKHYCGAQRLSCTCCPEEYCGPLTACNCTSCRTLDSDAAIRKMTSAAQTAANQRIFSDVIFESWLWGQCPSTQAKKDCQRILLNELHDIALQAASNCLSATHLKQQLYIYERFFVALARTKQQKLQSPPLEPTPISLNSEKREQILFIRNRSTNPFIVQTVTKRLQSNNIDVPSPIKEPDRATLGLARVGTRAALNFSFAFLRRAWRSGEDTELCSELLSEALESLQDLPEASLFETQGVSPLWMEVLERSIKFLRQVALGDQLGGRCLAPREDRHTALCLLLELGAQKGTLAATLEAIVLLLTLWEKEKETEDNREPENSGAPLVPILRRYESIGNYGFTNPIEDSPSTATESFLRFLTLPEHDTANIDLKQAAVVIISHIDRLAKPLIPKNIIIPTNNSISISSSKTRQTPSNISFCTKVTTSSDPYIPEEISEVSLSNHQQEEQRIYALGWPELSSELPGFTSEPAIRVNNDSNNSNYNAAILHFDFQVKQVAFSEDVILFLTNKGRLYTWRISKPEADPIHLEAVDKINFTSIASHIEGKHFLATDSLGDGFAWGCGDGGRLGVGDTLPREEPTQITCMERSFRSVHCGCSYSAAITTSGALYTWGKGNFGRLGHGSSDDKLVPTYVAALRDHHVVDVSLGSGDAHTLCVTADGLLFAWGDGEFGKLGNGSFNGSNVPIIIENMPKIQRVFCGPQFSIALSQEGKLYSWGKACPGRLTAEHNDKNLPGLPTPKFISSLQNKVIVDVSIGLFHCLALTNNGEVLGWGRNDVQQICPTSISREAFLRSPILASHQSVHAYGIASGPMQSIIWSRTSIQGIPTKEPFVIDLTEHTFRLLDQLIGLVCGQDAMPNNRQTPSQESECIAVACLNLLRLQLHSLIANNIAPKSVGLVEGSRLLVNLKTRILNLAGGANVLRTIQKAAQKCLEIGWSILLPTASERAQTLTSLLPAEPGITSPGHRFMTDLLVGSLMAEGGLETALNQAIHSESSETSEYCTKLPLLHLITQLLRNNSYLTQAHLTQLMINPSNLMKNEDESPSLTSNIYTPSPSLDLLHRFQRLLFSYLHQTNTEDISGAETLLTKYVQSVVSLSILSLQKAHEISLKGKDGIPLVLNNDISDTLLFELIIGLILLKRDRSNILASMDWIKVFIPLLHALDNFNRSIGFSDIQDFDDLSWPGIICRSHQKFFLPYMDDYKIIRKSEFENELLDGGKVIIIKGHVCDISDYKCGIAVIDDFLEKNIGKDLTPEFRNPLYRSALEFIFNNHNIGQYGPAIAEEKSQLHLSRLLTHLSSERGLAYLLGIVANLQQIGPQLQPAELHCKNIAKSKILSGGLQLLQPNNPFDEEKGEARSSASTAGNTPTETPLNTITNSIIHHGGSNQQSSVPNIQKRIEMFVNNLAEAKTTEPLVVTWLTLSERFCKENSLMWHQEFPIEHPIQELERLLTAVLIRHQSLGGLVLNTLELELNGTSMTSSDLPNIELYERCSRIPKEIADIIRLVYQTKWTVIRTRQQLNRSYKEVCAPMLERLRFLLYEVRPALSLEQEGLKKLSLLHKLPRFRQLVKNIIVDMRAAKKQLVCAKPEDILNVTIQSQNAAQRLNQSQESLLLIQQNQNQNQQQSQQQVGQQQGPQGQVVDLENDEKVSMSTDSGICSGSTLVANTQQELLEATENNLNLSCERKCSNEDFKMPTSSSTDLCLEDKKQEEDSKPQINNEFLKKLSEKWYFLGELNKSLMQEIVEFVLLEDCDVETVRRAMFCQVQRYHIRKKGLELFYKLIKQQGLLDAVQYNMISGYLGLNHKNNKQSVQHILNDLNWLTAFQKASLILAQSKIFEWAVSELQRLVNKQQPVMKSKQSSGACGKDNSNFGTYSFLKKLPRARFLLSIFGILSKDMKGNEISLLINSGLLGVVLALLSQTGGDTPAVRNNHELSIVYEDTILKQKSNKANLSGPELAKLMKIGTRIVRGNDWKWGDQDGNPPGEGRIISEVGEDGWVRVEWFATGATNSYRMGKEGQYDLRLADSALNVISPDSDTEKDDFSSETTISGETHPTKLLRYACAKFLQIIAVGIGMHSSEMDKYSVRTIASMFRSILDTKSTLANICGLDNWTTLGFLRSICGESKVLSKHLTSASWLSFYINLLEQPTMKEQDVFRKVHCLRLLQTVLIHWVDDTNPEGMANMVEQLFSSLGKITLYCPNDISLQQNYQESNKPRILLSASHSGTVAEEIITLLRKLHTLPHWNGIINSFLSQKLCVAAELFGEASLELEHLESEYTYVMGVLNTIGGCDLRPRIGLQVCHEGCLATVCGFTTKGKCLLSTEGPNSELRKVPLMTIMECADYTVFSLSRLPMNEMLLNSWSILLYGPGERKESIPNLIDISLLRSQQIQLSVLNANCVLYRHQLNLRNILKQRSPMLHCYSNDDSFSDEEGLKESSLGNSENDNDSIESNIRSSSNDHELLVQSILIRATQPSPVKAIYSFSDLAIAALNCTQLLASQVHTDLNETSTELGNKNDASCTPFKSLQKRQPTMIHGVPLYNTAASVSNAPAAGTEQSRSSLDKGFDSLKGAVGGVASPSNISIGTNTLKTTAASNEGLINKIKEMGFQRASIEMALQKLATGPKPSPTPEQVVQYMLEHPECLDIEKISGTTRTSATVTTTASTTSTFSSTCIVGENQTTTITLNNGGLSLLIPGIDNSDSGDDSETDSDSTSDTIEGSSLQEIPQRFETRADFQTADQYAIYVRGLICPGALVRCYRDFEEIKKGDIGTVLKVDTEGLHNLNVQVDWQIYGNTYWVCFVHLELIYIPNHQHSQATNGGAGATGTASGSGSSGQANKEKISPQQSGEGNLPIMVGSQVKLKTAPRYKWGHVTGVNVGTVVAIIGKEIFVDFPQLAGWRGFANELELINTSIRGSTLLGLNNLSQTQVSDLIDDWSRCIRSLTVSSNKDTAKNLLENTSEFWQSASNGQDRHWIRLEMHENILIHNLTMTVSPEDHSHMPSLVVTRVGDSLDNLNEFSWISIKHTDTCVTLMSNMRQYYPWIEIVIKQCRNNGIQCKVHRIDIVGRKKQNDLDLMLLNASFLANDYDDSYSDSQQQVSSSSSLYSDSTKSVLNDIPCTVMVWGLNDKEQLGGLKGSKVKVPTISQSISRLRPIHIVGGSKSLFIVSQDGKVYACGEGTNGRLGLGLSSNVSMPRLIQALHQYVVKKVAVHSGGKHALALTLDGKVFSWGEGEDGKLGHGNRLTLDKPKLIEAFRSKKIRDIACGSSHSAAITSAGELYTWGLGEYGRLGHGDNSTQLKPKLVTALLGKRVIQVACGSRDAQTLALTEDGIVYSWGDGDFGKLGRGGSEGSAIPHEIERLTGLGVIQIECGAQFSLALTRSGDVWTWGKGDYYRLGHGNDQHVRKPQPVQGLKGCKVIHVAVGALHCLAVTDSGQVYAWGDNDHGQQGSGNTSVNKRPSLVIGLDSVFVNRVACGSSHSIAWGMPQTPAEEEKKGPVPFSSNKDPLGGNSLGIYDSEESDKPIPQITHNKHSQKSSLSDILLSLDTNGARQTALNYILNAMSILQARQLIISALTSHCKVNLNDKNSNDIDTEYGTFKDPQSQVANSHKVLQNPNEIIAQGGGEAPADALDPAVHENSGENDLMPAPAGPLSAFHSLTGSMSLSGSLSSNAPHKHSKMSASAMSVMAATMTNQEEIIEETSLTGLDDFTSLLGESEAKSLVELLKLSVAGRTGPPSTAQTIADTLIALGSNSPAIGAMLLETCIVELEDLCTSRYSLGKLPKPVLQESPHPYVDNMSINGHVKIPGAEALRLEFDTQCSTEKRNDPLVIMDGAGRVVGIRSGREFSQWATEIRITGDEMRWKFTSDSSVNGWGFRFWVHAIMPTSVLADRGSDRTVLSQPSIALVMALLNERLMPHNTGVLLRLAAALSSCAQLNSLTTQQRIWALKHLQNVLAHKYAPKPSHPSLAPILMPLIPELLRQYEYEEPQVRGGLHLMHSEYFKTLAALATDMELDAVLPHSDTHKWSWFKRYCIAIRVAKALINRTELPRSFCLEVRKKLSEMLPTNNHPQPPPPAPPVTQTLRNLLPRSTSSLSSSGSSVVPSHSMLMNLIEAEVANAGGAQEPIPPPSNTGILETLTHEDHNLFKAEHDSQLLQWLNRRPDDWALAWGGASTIYGWGHNHRGQLGGLEGSRIKTPTPCEALSLLRPVQLAGGEQTLFAVTPDGKLFATGYGAGGRLGVGGTDSWAVPTLISSLQHVFVKKVAVNSGGKHCLALTTEGEVYSWGEGEDGKLGHGNRMSYDRPKLIEDLNGVGVVDIACGSAHSAAITSNGHVLTWGKGRYGRLGHGDSEDQLRPKLVEALLGYKAIDIACGSGDAQTLCITDDDNVWSWGDGDYGKLGRGGSDGCKIPFKIENLAGLGVIKVECGSQFSVALTRSGAVYTWGKGDFHRLGHGSVDHVRRPKKVAALQNKKVVSIATGSLHCVACTEFGEVYTWGDNDEGQLGDGTVSAIVKPRLVQALQGKHIVKVTCGSAHTLALSTTQLAERVRPPPSPPLEYDLVRDLPPEALHSRLVLLHHFSELLCPCLTMLHITGPLSLNALKDVLVYSIKEAAFRKVIQTTMVRDKQHGPVIELNRIQVKRSRNKSGNGLAGIDGMKSVFGQMVQKLPLLTQESLSLPHRVWKVKFVGESVDDCGGGYSESIAEMCDELQNGSVPLLINTPNGRGEAGANRDCFLLDPTLTTVLQMNMFRFLGVLMGIAVRTGSPLSLNLAEPVWRQLAGEELRPSDLTEVDRDYVAGLLCIRNMENDPKVFNQLELPFSTSSAKGHEVPLSTRYTRITAQNRHEYVRLALNFRLHEFDEQVKAVRDGMSKVIPVPLLSLFSAAELQAMVCGSPDIPLGLLKSVATYKGFDPSSSLVQWFWEVMEEFTNQERSLFLRFVWGRTRLPRTIADFRGRDFVVQVLEKNPPDHFLPESYTCFFLLKMPKYSCKAVLMEKLKYAIHFCKSIDTDEYARVAMGDPTEATGSEDNSDIESVTSHDV